MILVGASTFIINMMRQNHRGLKQDIINESILWHHDPDQIISILILVS